LIRLSQHFVCDTDIARTVGKSALTDPALEVTKFAGVRGATEENF